MAPAIDHVGPSSYSGFAKSLGRQTLRNYLLTAPTAIAIDLLLLDSDTTFATLPSNELWEEYLAVNTGARPVTAARTNNDFMLSILPAADRYP